MNNKKTLLISIVVLAGIIFYIFHVRNTREDMTSSETVAYEGNPVLKQSDNQPIRKTSTDQVSAVPPLEPEIRAGLEDLLDTSHEGLEKEEIDGAVIINLQGRFRIAPVATVDENGEIHIQEYSTQPAGPAP